MTVHPETVATATTDETDRAQARQAFLDGYASATIAMSHAVYMDDTRREAWLSVWAACEADPPLLSQREEAIERACG